MIKSKQYLYLLVFQDQPLFKIGISSNSLKRSDLLSGLYKFDFDRSLIITSSKDSFIPVLERELLLTFDNIDNSLYSHFQGYTEIRDLKYFSQAVQIINQKSNSLEIKVTPFQIVRKFEESNLSRKIKKVKPSFQFSCHLEQFKIVQRDFIGFFQNVFLSINSIKFSANSEADFWEVCVNVPDDYINRKRDFLSDLIYFGRWGINSFDHCSTYLIGLSMADIFNSNDSCIMKFYVHHKLNCNNFILSNNDRKYRIRNTPENRRHIDWLQLELKNRMYGSNE